MTDKYENGYVPMYLELASLIGISGTVCEVGVRDGSSLELWQAFFAHGVIVGVDVDENATWPSSTHRIVSNQADATLPDKLRDISPTGYDLIVDDASHSGHLTHVTYVLLWPLVKPGRWYVIEDWGVGYVGQAPMYDEAMRDFAKDLVDDIHLRTDVDEIRYSRGLITLQKRI